MPTLLVLLSALEHCLVTAAKVLLDFGRPTHYFNPVSPGVGRRESFTA